jgi:cephalosporin hydroxylase
MNKPWDEEFEVWRNTFLDIQAKDAEFNSLSKAWMQKAVDKKFSYQFDWMGVPIIQMPGDLVMFQDIVWKTRPDLIIETGIARGGSLIFWASMQKLCGINGKVLGVDIDIRDHAKRAISGSQFSQQIELMQGSSTDLDVFKKVKQFASPFKKIMIALDSNHTHEHVLDELKLYADLVSPGCILLVLDTVIDDLEADPDRPWGPGASPKSAVIQFMKSRPGIFENLSWLERRSVLSVAPNGYWLRSDKSKKE